jgi:hypothetical protein
MAAAYTFFLPMVLSGHRSGQLGDGLVGVSGRQRR